MPIRACVFDAYGTLFDVAAAAREAAAEPGNEELGAVWPELAENWRRKQLQYSWLRAISGAHRDFWRVTEDGLDWAMEAAELHDPALRERLLALYFELSAYPEVPYMLQQLKSAGFATAILSNGSPAMLDGAVRSAGLGHLLDAVLSVEDVGIFKPAERVYEMVGTEFDTDPSEVLFVSSNGWDAAHAKGFGFYTVWVNRAGEPIDRLDWTPDRILDTLNDIPHVARTA